MPRYKIFLTLLIVGGYLGSLNVFAVSPNRLYKLKREEFLQLDRDGADVYDISFDQLDNTNITYDDELLKLLRAYRNSILFPWYDFTYSNDEVMHRSQGSRVNRKLCHKQLETLLALSRVAHEQEPENYGLAKNGSIPFSAINFLDTYGHTESGILDGNYVWMGSYSGCVRAKIPARSAQVFTPDRSEGSNIHGRYCVAHLKAKSWPKWDIYFENRISIKVGLCLPESCHSLDYAQNETIRANVDYLARTNLLQPFNSNRYYTDHLYCLPDEDSPFRQLDLGAKLFLAFCLCWAIVLIYANIVYGIRMRKLRKLQETPEVVNGHDCQRAMGADGTAVNDLGGPNLDLVKAFSIVSNLEILCGANISGVRVKQSKRLLAEPNRSFRGESDPNEQSVSLAMLDKATNSTSRDQVVQINLSPNQPGQVAHNPEVRRRRINFNVLYGIKAGCMSIVLLGHSFLISFTHYKNLKDLNLKRHDIMYMTIMNGLHSVNLFYILTGILISYFAFKEQEKLTKPAYWILVIVRRYLRLLPAYILVFCFAKYIAPYTGSGPTWTDYRTDAEHPRSFCSNESWLSMLTLTSTYNRIFDGCLPHTWYLRVDFKLVLIIPFYITLLSRNKFFGFLAIFLTFIGCFWRQVSLLQAVNVNWSQQGLYHRAHSIALMSERSFQFYTDVLARLIPCLMGVMCGHLIHLYETCQISDWPRWFRQFGLKFSLSLVILTIVGPPIAAANQVMASPNHGKEIPSNLVAFLFAVLKDTVEILFCIILVLLITGGGFKTLNKLLSSRLAKIFSILSYGVFLVHVELMYKCPAYQGDYYYMFLACFGLLINFVSNLVSILVHVLYEMPINHVTRNYLNRIAMRTN